MRGQRAGSRGQERTPLPAGFFTIWSTVALDLVGFGIAIPVLVRYDDYTVDIAENQILLAAVDRLIRLPRLRASTAVQLRSLIANLADVERLHAGSPLPFWQPSRLNQRYQPALHLAELILADASFNHRAGDIRATGFMVDMSRVFEDFVTAALSATLEAYGGRCRPQDGNHLDEAGRVRIRPDLVWYGPRSQPRAVIDAKYKAEKPSGFPDADLYQMLAYCTVLGLDCGHLVYAKGNETTAVHIVRNAGTSIHCHALDLAQPPDHLLAQVDTLSASIASLASLSASAAE